MSSLALILLALVETSTASSTPALVPPADEPSSDLAERLIVRFGVSFDPTLGVALADDTNLRLANTFLNGDLALGTRGLLWPTLNTYALGQAALELQGAPTLSLADDPHAERAVLPRAQHAFPDGRALLLHLAYAELEGLSREGVLSELHLRGGRQLHFGLAPVTFDGGTLGYDGRHFAIAVRAGQRAASYDRSVLEGTTPGLVWGADARISYAIASLKAEYLHHQRTIGLIERDRLVSPGRAATADIELDLARLTLEVVPVEALVITARASMVVPDVSHLQLSVAWSIGRTTVLLDYDQKVGPDLVFGLASGTGVTARERRTTYETLRLDIPDLRPYGDLRASVMFDATEWLELVPTLGGRVVLAEDAERSGYDADRVVWGLAASARLPSSDGARTGLELFADYLGIAYLRPDGTAPQANFRDATTGESLVHDLSAGLRWVRRGPWSMAPIDGRLLSHRALSSGVYGFLSSARLASRYLTGPLDEVTVGGGADVRWDPSPLFGVTAAYELARGSSAFADGASTFHALRLGVQGRL